MLALTRAVSRSLDRCELTQLSRAPIDVGRARAQHRAYEEALSALGARVISLAEEPEMPDAVFVEDTAVVVDELAVITRPGAEARRAEVESVARALAEHRPLARIEAPATLDGGDVLRAGRALFVGRSGRTNEAGIAQLGALLGALGYTVSGVSVRGCLHLKSAVTEVADGLFLVNPEWIDAAELGAFGVGQPVPRVLEVDPSEPSAANALRLGGAVIHAAGHARTRERLERAGIRVVAVDVSELEKAEAAVTCCSLLL
jgi:dimethylargininase